MPQQPSFRVGHPANESPSALTRAVCVYPGQSHPLSVISPGENPLRHEDGRAYGAYGLFLTPRDFLRFGQASLDAARGDASIVSSAYLAEATSFQVVPEDGEGFDFGYFFWARPSEDAFTTWGHGGQFAYAVASLDLVVVITADPNSGKPTDVRAKDARALVRTLSAGA